MAQKLYNWNRFWVPRDGYFSYDSEGFLLPGSEKDPWTASVKNESVTFEEIANTPCLALLGEPGIGKSFAMRSAELAARAQNKSPNCAILSVNLRSFSDEQRLVDSIFGSNEFKLWQDGNVPIQVFLDSLDECLLRIDTVAALMVDHFDRLPSVAGLSLRIACRTADWPKVLEDGLQRKWNSESFKVYELAQLTRAQVEQAALVNCLPHETFTREITSKGVVSFAVKPLTLEFLIKVYASQGKLPDSKYQIYKKGCNLLCEEQNDSRVGAKMFGQLSSDERIAIASHIAAGTVFCNRAAIWTGSNAQKPESDLSLSELAEGDILIRGRRLNVSEAALRETLGTGLFSSRGPNRLGWAHQTYGEFLAAEFAVKQNLTEKQILSLVCDPFDSGQHLIPQLRETVAWLGLKTEGLMRHVLEVEPHVLLSSDVATADYSAKATLVDAILKKVSGPVVWHEINSARQRYSKLNYPGLANQLRAFIGQRQPSDVRYEAIEIAEACKLTSLLPKFVPIALDSAEDANVRANAVSAIARLGDEKTKAKLKPLAMGQAGPDPNDDLRGFALTACWPKHISATELFATLKTPRRSFLGMYRIFLRDGFIAGLQDADLPIALKWIANLELNHHMDYPWEETIDELFDLAAQRLDIPEVLKAFADAISHCIRKRHHPPGKDTARWKALLNGRPDLRLRLLDHLLPFVKKPSDAVALACYDFRFVRPDDLPWLAERLTNATPERQRALAQLMLYTISIADAGHVDAVIMAAEKHPVVAEVFAYWLRTRELADEKTTKERDEYLEIKRLEKEASTRKPEKPDGPLPSERIKLWLTRFENGELNAWWRLTLDMAFDDEWKPCDEYYSIDLRQMPGWMKAEPETRQRILDAAEKYAVAGDPKPAEWFDRDKITYYPAAGGINALFLLAEERPASFAALSDEILRKWAPIILAHPAYNDPAGHLTLVQALFDKAKPAALEWLRKVIAKEDREYGHLSVLSKLPEKLDDDVLAALMQDAEKTKLKLESRKALLDFLLRRGANGARQFVISLLPRRAPKEKSRRERVLAYARILIPYAVEGDWAHIWRLIKQDASFGQCLMGGVAYDYYRSPAAFAQVLTAREIADFYSWLLEQYPPSDDPRDDGAHTVTTREAIASFRDQLVAHLAYLGTQKACSALEAIVQEHQEQNWLPNLLVQAKAELRRKSWAPPAAAAFFMLAANRRGSLVESEQQLMVAVMESLELLQKKLHDETPRAQFLWDGERPVDEAKLSDFVKAHLEDDFKGRGIIVNREVEIRRGQETDIHVDAISQDKATEQYDSVKIIIEVKGCWNKGLRHAMETQLIERYLKDNKCNHGIYLVGWFPRENWTRADSRRKSSYFSNCEALRKVLKLQAIEKSRSGKTVVPLVLDASIPNAKRGATNTRLTSARPRIRKRKP